MVIRYAVVLLMLMSISEACFSIDSSVRVISRFWEYAPDAINNSIVSFDESDYKAEDIADFTAKEKTVYDLLKAASCKSNDKYKGLWQYRCEKGGLENIVRLSQQEPIVFLFVYDKDRRVVIGYINRYIEFLKSEMSRGDSIPIPVSYLEYLGEISLYLQHDEGHP